jgi:hypothetical protein
MIGEEYCGKEGTLRTGNGDPEARPLSSFSLQLNFDTSYRVLDFVFSINLLVRCWLSND